MGFSNPWAPCIHAQTYPFLTYSVEDGLGQSVVRDMLEDSRGYLWLATAGGGVSRWDGTAFLSFDTTDGLPNGRVSAVLEDHQGHLWFGTEGGLASYDGQRIALVPETQGLDILSLFEDSSGTLWIGTAQGSLMRYQGEELLEVPVRVPEEGSSEENSTEEGSGTTTGEPLETGGIGALTTDRQGTLWVGSQRGLWRVQDERLEPAAPELGPKSISSLFLDSQGSLWAGLDDGGVARRSGADGFLLLDAADGFPATSVRSMSEDPQGRLWFATVGEGAIRWDGETFFAFNESNGLPGQGVLDVLTDTAGSLWLAVFGNGISRLASDAFVSYSTEDGLPGDKVLSITEDPDGFLRVGIFEGGLARKDDQGFTVWNRDSGLPSELVTSVLTDRRGDLWIGTLNAGLSRLDGQGSEEPTFERFDTSHGLASNRVFSLFEDRQGDLWIATFGGGVSRWDGQEFTTLSRSNGLASDRIYSVFQDRDGFFWFATADSGVSRYDGEGFLTYSEADGLLSNRVYAIRQDPAGRLWMATDRGLSRWDGEGFESFTRSSGLTSQTQYFLHIDAIGRLWVGGERGVDCIELDPSGEFATVHGFGRQEGFFGLETNQNAVFEDRSGVLWIGTQGLTRLDPRRALSHRPAPSPHLTELQLQHRSVDWSAEEWSGRIASVPPWFGVPVRPRLRFDQNHLAFRYSAPALDADGILFQTRLRGLEEEWSPPTRQRQAIYPSLPPGDFVFEVRASRDGRNWSQETATLQLSILPPFWRTWWFLLTAVLLLALAVLAMIRWRTHWLEERRKQLRAEVASRTQQLQLAKNAADVAARAKSQFLNNMSHELRTPLADVIGLAGMLRATGLDSDQEEITYTIEARSEALLKILEDLLELTQQESSGLRHIRRRINLRDLIRKASAAAAKDAHSKGLNITWTVDADVPRYLFVDPVRLWQLLASLLGNAVKFTDAGEIDIQAKVLRHTEDGLDLELEVRDTGIGIAPGDLGRLFDPFFQVDSGPNRRHGGTGLGLALCDLLAQQMGGELRVESELGKGSTFSLILPTSEALA
ncbi:MAG: two-component regulator propeller domain-containing protein [Acidobacteriota bacterium]|nr:two-component regulator propeller domain-containing protein [Acidobacteriota bacterium]